MPVTAKLSRLFYERLGEQVVNELVDWFNQVDATYRSDLREMNEANYARFDAKLEQRIAELRTELREAIANLRTELKTEIATLRSELKGGMGALRRDMDVGFADVRGSVERNLKEQARWFITALIAVTGVMIALLVNIRLQLP